LSNYSKVGELNKKTKLSKSPYSSTVLYQIYTPNVMPIIIVS